MARDVHGRRLAGARDLPTDRQGLASRASGRLRGGLPLSQGRGLAAGAGGASRAARVAAERAGPPGPRGAGERRGTQAAPPAARRGTGRDRPRTRQDLGPWDRQPHARRAKIPRGDEPEDAGQGPRAECSRCWSSCRCRIPQASIPTPSRRAAEQFVAQQPSDPHAHLALGWVWQAWPAAGRYRALDEFRTAERLAPGEPAPLWGQVAVGYRLGSDEGEGIARRALLRLLELRPGYRLAWARFLELYHDDAIWRRVDRALALHPDDLAALERRALIAIALEQPERADSLAAQVLARRGPHVPAWLVRAEASFQTGRDSAGYAWYDSALGHADLDSSGALWANARLIATPDEAARFAATGPGDARRFFLWFWSKRDPNLITPQNERIAEHFRRLAVVRRRFQLLHPLSLYHRSATARRLATAALPGTLPQFVAAALGPDADDPAGERSIYSRCGLDARGLVWLRHGPPDSRDPVRLPDLPGMSSLDAEAWHYETAAGRVGITFTRASASAGLQLGGDYIFTPTSKRQMSDTRRLLETDRTTLRAPLAARVWAAFFRGRTPGRTEVYYRSATDTAGLALWDERGVAVALASGPGLSRASVPPGHYTFGLDVDSAGVLGRIRDTVTVPHFARAAAPLLSSLILGATDSSGDRDALLAAMPADLAYRAGAVR